MTRASVSVAVIAPSRPNSGGPHVQVYADDPRCTESGYRRCISYAEGVATPTALLAAGLAGHTSTTPIFGRRFMSRPSAPYAIHVVRISCEDHTSIPCHDKNQLTMIVLVLQRSQFLHRR
jgi:hypothetical protein